MRLITEKKVKISFAMILALSLPFMTGCSKYPWGSVEVDARITEVYGNADSIVTIISDDGYYDSAVNLNELLRDHNLKATVAGAVCIIEPELEGWKALVEEGNIDLVNHSYDHLRMDDEGGYDKSVLTHEIIDADRFLEEFTGSQQIVFVCPENQMCEEGYKILKNNGFWAVRLGNRGFNSLSPEEGNEPGQWFHLNVCGIRDEGVNTDVRHSWVDASVAEHAWLIEMWHNVMPYNDGMYQSISIEWADEHLSYIEEASSQNKVWVATFTEAVKYIRERQNSDVVAYILENELHLTVRLNRKDMDPSVFNVPVTVEVKLPDDGGIKYFNVTPGQELIVDLDG